MCTGAELRWSIAILHNCCKSFFGLYSEWCGSHIEFVHTSIGSISPNALFIVECLSTRRWKIKHTVSVVIFNINDYEMVVILKIWAIEDLFFKWSYIYLGELYNSWKFNVCCQNGTMFSSNYRTILPQTVKLDQTETIQNRTTMNILDHGRLLVNGIDLQTRTQSDRIKQLAIFMRDCANCISVHMTGRLGANGKIKL